MFRRLQMPQEVSAPPPTSALLPPASLFCLRGALSMERITDHVNVILGIVGEASHVQRGNL